MYDSITAGQPDYWSMIIGTGITSISALSRFGVIRHRDKQGLSLVNVIMDRQFEYEKLQREYNLKSSQYNFFTKELIGLIGSCEHERLVSINLALQALIYDKEGVIQKDLKDIRSLLARRHAEEDVLIPLLQEVKEQLPSNGVLNGKKKAELQKAFEQAEIIGKELARKEQRYIDLMNSLDVGVLLIDNNGVIIESNEFAMKSIPGISIGIGQHWTWNMMERPEKQVMAMMRLINGALSGKGGFIKIVNYQFADGGKASALYLKASPIKSGDIVDHVFLTLQIEDGDISEKKVEISQLEELERKAQKMIDNGKK